MIQQNNVSRINAHLVLARQARGAAESAQAVSATGMEAVKAFVKDYSTSKTSKRLKLLLELSGAAESSGIHLIYTCIMHDLYKCICTCILYMYCVCTL